MRNLAGRNVCPKVLLALACASALLSTPAHAAVDRELASVLDALKERDPGQLERMRKKYKVEEIPGGLSLQPIPGAAKKQWQPVRYTFKNSKGGKRTPKWRLHEKV